MAAAIGQRLSMSRQRVDALHAVQRLSALRQAAATLAHKDLPNASADATAQLCTQPAEARARVLIAVQRAAIVVSAVETLAEKNDIDNNDPTTNGNSEFQTAAKNLRAAMLSMRRALSAHYFPSDHQTHDSFTDEDHQQQQHQQPHHYIRDGVHDYDYDSQVLSLEDATNSRLLLGDDMSSVKHDFFRAVAYYAAAPLPTAAAIAAAGKLRTGVARLHAVFCNAEVIPRMCDATRWYANIFSMSHNKPRTSNDGGDKLDDSEDHDGWHELMVCLSGVAEDAVAGRVRAALQSGSNNELSVEEIQGVASLVKAVKGLADGGSDPQEKEGTESVSAVLRACIHGLVGYIHTSVRDVAQRQLRSAFDAGANGSGNINKAAQAIQATVSEIASWGIDILFNNGEGVESDNNSQSDSTDRQTDDNGGASIKKVEMEKLIESAANSFTDPISSTFKQSARVATICDYLHEAYPGLGASGCSESLREASKQQARTAIGQALRQRLHTLSNDKSPQLAADLFTSAVTTLRDAEVVGKECDVPAMRRARDVDVDGSNGVGLDDGEQYAFLDDGWLARAVLRDWLAEIKTSSTNKKLTARVARTLQMDAAVLRQVVGYDVVDMVADAVEAGGQIFDSQFEKLDTRSALDLAMREKSNEYSNVMSHNL